TPFLILLLYFLKMKRKALQVPSTFLWKKSIEDIHVNSLFQWMRDNVLLLLQLLIVLILIYGVMALQSYAANGSGVHYILLIDSSASMAVADVDGRTRLDAAKDAALQTINAHGQGDVGMVIEFNSGAQVRQKYTTKIDDLRNAVASIKQTNRTTHLQDALNLADALANPARSTANQAVTPQDSDPGKARTYVDIKLDSVAAEVHLFSDGRFTDVTDFAAGNLDIRYHRVGKPDQSDNVAIVAFNAERDDKGAGSLRVFLRVLNYRGEAVHTQVKLDEMDWTTVDGHPALHVVDSHIKPVDVDKATGGDPKEPAARNPGEATVTFEVADPGDGSNRVLRASLLDNKDAFPADDVAWLAAGAVRKAHVLVVTDGNDVLHKFFDLNSVQKVAVFTYIKPADLKDQAKYLRPARIGAYDLVVFDRCHPDNLVAMPAANTYFIDDLPPPWTRPAKADLAATHPLNPTSDHPLMEQTTGLNEIHFSDAFFFELDPDKYGRIGLNELKKIFKSDKADLSDKVKNDVALQENLFNKYGGKDHGYLSRGDFKKLWEGVENEVQHKDAKPDADDLFQTVDTDETPVVPPRIPRLLEVRLNGPEAVLFAMPRSNGYTDLVQTFALINDKGEWMTDWMKHYSFPKFMRNVLYQLGGVSDAATLGTLQPGQIEEIRPEAAGQDVDAAAAGPKTVQVWDETAQASKGTAPEESSVFAYKDTENIGAYLATWEGGRRGFAVNLLDENESDIRPRDEIKVGAQVLQATAAPYHGEPIDLWPFAAAAALLLLLVEWALYHFRVFG
ncbi:MAG TPA: VWA domain-containing protein, partial [Gemmataceae bacterium]|nr:VWA domain-containing protein [Gemmataceae bacterium]